MNCYEPNDQELSRVESLLRSAAAYEPDRPAPIGLAARALAPKQHRRAPRRAVYGLGFALSVAGAAAAAALILRSPVEPAMVSPTQFASHPVERIKHAAVPPLEVTPRVAASRKKEQSSSPKISNAFEKRRITFKPKRTKYRRANPEKPVRAVMAKAQIIEETVHRFEIGILAPVLVATQDAETGETIMQPTLMEIPIEHQELVMSDGYDGFQIQQVNFEENE